MMVNIIPAGLSYEERRPHVIAHAACICLLLEDYDMADRMLEWLLEKQQRHMIHHTLPHLDDLVLYFPQRQRIKTIKDKIDVALFPKAKPADAEARSSSI